MADSGLHQDWDVISTTEKWQRKRKYTNELERSSKTITSEACDAVDIHESNESITEQQLDTKRLQRMNRNISGLKDVLRGTPYQLKFVIVVSLTNATESMDPENKTSITVTAGNPNLGNFDDILYEFLDGYKTRALKIQIKHEFGSDIPRIKLNDVTTTHDLKNPFAILKYFTSFYDQPPQTDDMERIIQCTNSYLDSDARELWKSVDPTRMCDSTTSLDSYVSTLFTKVGGECYQLDFDTLTDGSFNELYQRMREYSKSTRLAKLLVNAIKSEKHRLTLENPVVREYHRAILKIIDTNDRSTTGSYKFSKEFLDPSLSNSTKEYEAFRVKFEEEYSEVANVWKVLENKRLHVAEDVLSEDNESALVFPGDDVDERLIEFCQRFRLVCYTKIEDELDETIAGLWKNMYSVGDMIESHPKGTMHETMLFAKVRTNFDWLMDLFFKPVDSENIEQDLQNIENALTITKLKSVSDQFREEIVRSRFRITTDALKASELYDQIDNEVYLQLDAYDVNFGSSVLYDIISLQEKELYEIFFINSSLFMEYSKKVKCFIRDIKHRICLVIICNELFIATQRKVQELKTEFLETSQKTKDLGRREIGKRLKKQVFLVRKSNPRPSIEFGCFRIKDITEESWKQFIDKSIPLCSMNISPAKLFQNNFRGFSIEEFLKLLNSWKQMKENDEMKYREFESTYVHRPWINQEIKLNAENIQRNEVSRELKIIDELQQGEICWNEITKTFKNNANFGKVFGNVNNSEKEHESIIGDEGKKVLILLGEAGSGKSTNLTWFSWYLRKRNPSSWVVRCNLSDHCSDFKPFIQNQNNETAKVINETGALRMLYKLYASSFQLEREKAEKYATYLVYSDGAVMLREDLMKNHDLPLNFSIQLLVFREKFKSGELILLLDGFDEIAPYYKEVVFEFLSFFEQFKGVRNLYLTSHPYGFKEQFEKACKDSSFFKLKPLSLEDKGSILFKMMKVNWNKGNIDDEEESDIYKSLCYMLLCSLSSMSDVPLILLMAVDILEASDYHDENINIEFSLQMFKMFETILKLSKASFIVEEFVKQKLRHLLYDKNEVNYHIMMNPYEMERFEKEVDRLKLFHGLLALWVLFHENDRHIILSPNEKHEAEDIMDKLLDGREKTGIIHGIQDGVPMFIHRSFVDYLAAWWIVKRRIEVGHQRIVKISCLESFWDEDHKELRENIDTILAKRHPLHVAIVERDWKKVESLLSSNPNSLYERDDGKRTALHLMAFYYDFEKDWPHFLPDSIKSFTINAKEKLFEWTALDIAFHMEKPRLIFYLLHHGASINVNVLYEQVVSARNEKLREAAKYARYVMSYLSKQAIDYKAHDACIQMKEFCDILVADSDNETSFWNRMYSLRFNDKEKSILKDVIEYDAVWMLKSVIQRRAIRFFFGSIQIRKYFDEMVENNSILMVKYLTKKDSSILHDEHLWKCAVYAALNDYKIEFKYFVDLYCSRFKIKDFQSCSIKSDEPDYSMIYLSSDTIDNVYRIINSICRAKLSIPAGIVIDGNILSLLVICVATVRPSMVRYIIESCMLHLNAGLVYYLAMVTCTLISKITDETAIQSSKVFDCLLDLASNISHIEMNKMLRLAITSNLFEFSKYLIERYNIDFQAVDKLKGRNVFHLCASNQWSFRVEEVTFGDFDSSYVDGNNTNLFRYMLAKASDMDCFGVFDKKGRSIIHLAMENEQRGITELILTRKLGLNDLKEIRNLRADAIPNITFCFHAIQKISKSVGEKRWHYNVLCMLAKQMAKISLTIDAHSKPPNSTRLLLQENAKELYQMAIKCRSLFLMYYLHREFSNVIPLQIYDADWLVCTVGSLRSPDFLDVTKWLLNPNEVDQLLNLYEIVEKCEVEDIDLRLVNLEKLIIQAEVKLSENQSVEEVCKMKLLAFAVCLQNESMIRYLCETLNVNIEWKVLVDIMEIAHHSHIDEPRTRDTNECSFETPDFVTIYKYLFEQTSNPREIDTEGRNMLHVVVQSGLGCVTKFLIKQNLFSVTTANKQNGWNIFHYFAARKGTCICHCTENGDLVSFITRRVLEVTSDYFPPSSSTESHKNKIKELCFNSNGGRKSVIHVAVEAGNTETAEYIIKCRLGICILDEYEIMSSDECSPYIECYEEVYQIAAQLPFNGYCDYLLHCLAKTINEFSRENIVHTREQGNVDDVCRSAIIYRSASLLEHLMVKHEVKMHQALTRSTNNELIACMTECIRRNRVSMFKVLTGHYRNLQGIQQRVEIGYEEEQNESEDDIQIIEGWVQWSVIKQFSQDLAINRDYLPLVILSVAYGRLSMTRFFDEMFQMKVNKSLIVLIMKVLEKLWNDNCKTATPVYEYLVSRCEGNLLHLCVQAECFTMLEYLIKEKKLDPNKVDPENGWNVGHFCVSGPISPSYKEFAWLVEENNIDCFGVYDLNNRSILHLALESGHIRVVKYIINHRLGINGDSQPWMACDIEKIEKDINELQQMLESLPETLPQQKQRVIQEIIEKLRDRINDLTTYMQLFT